MVDFRLMPDKDALGAQAAECGAVAIRQAIARHGEATIIVATGASQFEMLSHLVKMGEIDWSKVTAFHLDEYVGLSVDHPASFRRYLYERFVGPLESKVKFVPIDGTANIDTEIQRLNTLMADRRVDVCFAGIGENCHLAFNDPPADFTTTEPYLVVTLDEACRRQQYGEGWFQTLESVPKQAISMSVQQILKSALIVLSVSEARKAKATRDALKRPVSPLYPASILQEHSNTVMFVDPPAASLLDED